MKAILYRQYGPPNVLQYEDTPIPSPKENEVLIRVHAASVNPYDWHFMRGTPYLIRAMAGLRQPKFNGLGADLSGTIEALGNAVTSFQPGDEVFGVARGAFADYACAPVSKIAIKPPDATHEQAAAMPVAAITALQGLRDKGKIQAGQRVLVNGASGGVGTFSVQIAKSFGAHVTGVCSTRNLEMVRSIGADQVIDYTLQNFTQSNQRYDLILDAVGNHSPSALLRVLHPSGICVGAGGTTDVWMIKPLLEMIHAGILSSFGSRKLIGMLAQVNQDDLAILGSLLASGAIKSVIDRRFPLSETADAIRHVEEGHTRGKVILRYDNL